MLVKFHALAHSQDSHFEAKMIAMIVDQEHMTPFAFHRRALDHQPQLCAGSGSIVRKTGYSFLQGISSGEEKEKLKLSGVLLATPSWVLFLVSEKLGTERIMKNLVSIFNLGGKYHILLTILFAFCFVYV